MPRPAKTLSKQDKKEIEALAGYGVNQKQIAAIKGISVDTLRKYGNDAYKKGKNQVIAKVAQTAAQMAVSGKYPGNDHVLSENSGRLDGASTDAPKVNGVSGIRGGRRR
jgi:DNA-binding CsgD family transcriptional regulator